MTRVLVIIAVAVGWIGMRGELDASSLLSGVLVGLAVVVLLRRKIPPGPSVLYLPWFLVAAIPVVSFMVHEILVSNVDQLRVVFRPRLRVRPHWVELETTLQTPMMRALLGVMISMTPMTLMCDDRQTGGRVLLLHVLDTDDPERVVARLRRKLERPLLALERPWCR